MVAGAIGQRMVNVARPVVKARNSGPEPAPAHHRQGTESSVKENLSKAKSVEWGHAKVLRKTLPVHH